MRVLSQQLYKQLVDPAYKFAAVCRMFIPRDRESGRGKPSLGACLLPKTLGYGKLSKISCQIGIISKGKITELGLCSSQLDRWAGMSSVAPPESWRPEGKGLREGSKFSVLASGLYIGFNDIKVDTATSNEPSIDFSHMSSMLWK